jgi:DNA repair protein RecO (recombination protein O)
MHWSDSAIVIGTRAFGENGVILEVLTRDHGRCHGMVQGGRSRKMQPVLQAGNTLAVRWNARLDEHMGTFTLEAETLRAATFMASGMALYGMGTLANYARLLPERDPHPTLYDGLQVVLDHLDQPHLAPALFVRFEIALLTELGYGLDLSICAATGTKDNLIYVSPKSGRAVSFEAGEPYKNKLLPLPSFLRHQNDDGPPRPTQQDMQDGLYLSGFFLQNRVFLPRHKMLPEDRARFIAQI